MIYSKQVITKALNLREQGYSVRDIAKMISVDDHKVGKSTVGRWVQEPTKYQEVKREVPAQKVKVSKIKSIEKKIAKKAEPKTVKKEPYPSELIKAVVGYKKYAGDKSSKDIAKGLKFMNWGGESIPQSTLIKWLNAGEQAVIDAQKRENKRMLKEGYKNHIRSLKKNTKKETELAKETGKKVKSFKERKEMFDRFLKRLDEPKGKVKGRLIYKDEDGTYEVQSP